MDVSPIELELKFGLPPASVESLRTALEARGAERVAMRARYFDTPDGRLAEHRVALRLRQEDGHWVQTVKAEGESAVARLEHEIRIPVVPLAEPALDVRRHEGTPAGEVLLRALGGRRAAALVERYAVEVMRLRCQVHDAATTALEVALDEGVVRVGERTAPIVELEIEHLYGPVAGMFDLAAAWVRHGGLWLSTTPKSLRGQRLAGLDDRPPAPPRTLPPHGDGPALLRAIVHGFVARVLALAGDVAEGLDDAERVHDLRVALRRLRTALRELHTLAPDVDAAWEPVLAEAFGQLGARRDADAVVAAVRPLLAAADAPKLAWTAAGDFDVASPVRATALQLTLIAILKWLHAEPPSAAVDHERAVAIVAERLTRLHRLVTAAGRRFDRLAIEQQHRARKRLKRLRYLAEMAAPLYGGEDTRRYLALLAPAQDALGHHNDVVTAAAAFRADAVADPRSWFGAGYLQAHAATTAAAARRSLRPLRRAACFWRD